jgi:hypothetical protein
MMEFILRRTDVEGEWFSLSSRDFAKVLQPMTFKSETTTDSVGRHILRIGEANFVFVLEDPGIQVAVTGSITEAKAIQILAEILKNIEEQTGESGRIMEV